MPSYLPRSETDNTVFPEPYGKDLCFAVNLIKEKYERFYPEIAYESLKLEPTDVSLDNDIASGEVDTTAVDDLWGEDVLPSLDDWINPHSPDDSPTADAPDTRLFDDSVAVNARVQVEANEWALKKMGIDQMQDLLIHFSTYILDLKEIIVKIGDVISWGGEKYEILKVYPKGYWKNTNAFLYLLCDCKRIHLGT